MDLKYFCLLLCAAVMTVSGISGEDKNGTASRWTRQSIPLLVDTHTQILNTPLFRGQDEDEEKGGTNRLCGIECQRRLPNLDQSEQERILGYQTMYENSTVTHTGVILEGFNEMSQGSPDHPSTRTRRKRHIYGADGRFVISDSHFSTNYPFSTAVRLSSGCSGVLISSSHVLTAARCIHDGQDYLQSARQLKVGLLQLKVKRRGGKKRRGRRRGGSIGEEKGALMEEGEGRNSIEGDVGRGQKGGQGRRQRGRMGHGEVGEGEFGTGGKQRRRKLNRVRRGAEARQEPVFRWTPVKQTQIPQGWIHNTSSSHSPDYDYAVLELKRPVKQRFMKLGIVPSAVPLTRIHFSGYDADKRLLDGHRNEKVVYRFCSVAEESDDLMYQRCDAEPGATGAGVYVRLRQPGGDGARKGSWQRRVIGVFSGHHQVDMDGGEQRDYNVAVRITAPKYAQICHWIHGDPKLCKEL